MTEIKTAKKIGLLMGVAQLVLLVFVGYWLKSQFNQEKSLLKQKLGEQLEEAKLQVKDSMLLTNFIDPLFKNEKGFKVSLSDADSLLNSNLILPHQDKGSAKVIIQNDTIVLQDKSGKEGGAKMITINENKEESHEVLLHGIKLFIKKVTGTSGKETKMEQTFYYATDSVLLKKIVENKLKQSNFDFSVKWIQGSTDSIKGTAERMYLESNMFEKPYGFMVTDYFFYILKRIIPQLLFALILLLLTGIAFYLAFRSLKNQYQLNTIKNDFISNISHELKTPVSTIKVAIEAIQAPQNRTNTEKVNDYLRMAALETERLDLLIEKVMNTSLAEEDKHFFNPKNVNVVTLIRDVIQNFSIRLKSANASISLQTNREEIFLLLDEFHFQGVISNLIENSLKYSNTDAEIKVLIHAEVKSVTIQIEDNGPGIPEIYHQKIFDKFFRVPANNTHNTKGYGLGLSYAALVVKQNGGNISVKNNAHKGCTFTLTFPIKE